MAMAAEIFSAAICRGYRCRYYGLHACGPSHRMTASHCGVCPPPRSLVEPKCLRESTGGWVGNYVWWVCRWW